MNGDRAAREKGEQFSLEGICAPDCNRWPHPDRFLDSPNRATPLIPDLSPPRRQVITLAFLSERLAVDLFSAHLAASLWAETKEMVVLVRFRLHDDTADGTQPAVSLNGEFHMPPQIRRTDAGYHSLIIGTGREPPSPSGIASLVNQLRCHFQYVLLAAPVNEHSAPWLSECLLRYDLTYLLLPKNNDDVNHFDQLMSELVPRCNHGTPRIKLIGCVTDGHSAGGFDLFVKRTACPIHLFIHECPPASNQTETVLRAGSTAWFRADVRRF